MSLMRNEEKDLTKKVDELKKVQKDYVSIREEIVETLKKLKKNTKELHKSSKRAPEILDPRIRKN